LGRDQAKKKERKGFDREMKERETWAKSTDTMCFPEDKKGRTSPQMSNKKKVRAIVNCQTRQEKEEKGSRRRGGEIVSDGRPRLLELPEPNFN